jgi:hypothetical protein
MENDVAGSSSATRGEETWKAGNSTGVSAEARAAIIVTTAMSTTDTRLCSRM